MVTPAAHTARTVIGIIGNVISFCLFASPAPTLWRIYKKKSTEEFHPYPYIACVMNCLFWIFYGLPIVHPDSTLVITINGLGLVIELAYLIIFFIYTNRKYKLHIFVLLVVEIVLLAIVASITLKIFHTHKRRSMVAGIVCVIFGVIMYSAPLSIMRKVIKTKSVEFMPFWLSLASFSNGVIWTVYALLEFDAYILTSNGLGVLSGAVQLILYAFYFKRTPATAAVEEGDGELKQAEVQLEDKSPA